MALRKIILLRPGEVAVIKFAAECDPSLTHTDEVEIRHEGKSFVVSDGSLSTTTEFEDA